MKPPTGPSASGARARSPDSSKNQGHYTGNYCLRTSTLPFPGAESDPARYSRSSMNSLPGQLPGHTLDREFGERRAFSRSSGYLRNAPSYDGRRGLSDYTTPERSVHGTPHTSRSISSVGEVSYRDSHLSRESRLSSGQRDSRDSRQMSVERLHQRAQSMRQSVASLGLGPPGIDPTSVRESCELASLRESLREFEGIDGGFPGRRSFRECIPEDVRESLRDSIRESMALSAYDPVEYEDVATLQEHTGYFYDQRRRTVAPAEMQTMARHLTHKKNAAAKCFSRSNTKPEFPNSVFESAESSPVDSPGSPASGERNSHSSDNHLAQPYSVEIQRASARELPAPLPYSAVAQPYNVSFGGLYSPVGSPIGSPIGSPLGSPVSSSVVVTMPVGVMSPVAPVSPAVSSFGMTASPVAFQPSVQAQYQAQMNSLLQQQHELQMQMNAHQQTMSQHGMAAQQWQHQGHWAPDAMAQWGVPQQYGHWGQQPPPPGRPLVQPPPPPGR